MSLPIPGNTTCDIYRNGTTPPASPAVAGVPCQLTPDWRMGQEHGDRKVNTLTWTHIMLVDDSTDIRDAYTGQETSSVQDSVYIPDHTGTQYLVIFIEEMGMGTASAHKRVYLDRQTPNWSIPPLGGTSCGNCPAGSMPTQWSVTFGTISETPFSALSGQTYILDYVGSCTWEVDLGFQYAATEQWLTLLFNGNWNMYIGPQGAGSFEAWWETVLGSWNCDAENDMPLISGFGSDTPNPLVVLPA
jgi:hypothetical protein